jgi:excisionase family DNA binding protein
VNAIEPQMAYRRRGAARALDISEDSLDRLINRGEIRTVKLAGARLIPASEIEAFLQRKLEESN